MLATAIGIAIVCLGAALTVTAGAKGGGHPGIGTAKIEITPPAGHHLWGLDLRMGPSTGTGTSIR